MFDSSEEKIVKYKRNPDAKIKEVGDEQAIYVPSTRSIHVLNLTARLIWDLADEPISEAEMAAAIALVTDASEETALGDLREVLPTFVLDGILQEVV